MNKQTENPRIQLIREAAVLQLKLVADGFRDALLIPISLIAALISPTVASSSSPIMSE